MRPLIFYKELYEKYIAIKTSKAINPIDFANFGKTLKLEGFQTESDEFFDISVKYLQHFAQSGSIAAALTMESSIYNAFVKTTENEAHYFKCFAQWSELFQTLGRVHKPSSFTPGDPRKICFVSHNALLLGHTEVMLSTIGAWRAAGIDADIYFAVLGGIDPTFLPLLERVNVKLIRARMRDDQILPLDAMFLSLREQLTNLSINSAIWLSLPVFASYAMAFKLAYRQVLWSLKFHPVFVPEVDVHLCGGHEVESIRTYNGKEWTVSPFPLTVNIAKNSADEVAAYRAKFPADAILLGSLAREEKMTSPSFLTVLGTILSRNPKTHFLWTGHQAPQSVIAAFESYGVADRCHFIGWVNTNFFAEVLDIFLETFPFGCGITGFQAMGHGTPLLSMQAMDTLYGYQLLGAVKHRLGDSPPSREVFESLEILTAANPAHYVELAQKLIDDPAYRKEIGAREKSYFQKEQAALPRYAKRLWENMTGIPAGI